MGRKVKVIHAPMRSNPFTGNTLYAIEHALCLQDAGLDAEVVFIESAAVGTKKRRDMYERMVERRYDGQVPVTLSSPWHAIEADCAVVTDRTMKEHGQCISAKHYWFLDTWCGCTDDRFKIEGARKKAIYFSAMKAIFPPDNGKLFMALNGPRMMTLSDITRSLADVCLNEDITERTAYVDWDNLERNPWLVNLFDTVLTEPDDMPFATHEHVVYALQEDTIDVAPRLPYECAWYGTKLHDPLGRLPKLVKMDINANMFGRVSLTTDSKIIREIKEKC